MTKSIIHTDHAPNVMGPYSQGVTAGGLVFVAGQPPVDPSTGEVVGTTIQEQTAQCLRNVAAVLEAAGSSLEQAVSASFMLADREDMAGLNEEWAKWFPTAQPARQGAQAIGTAFKLSIAMVAVVSGTDAPHG